MNNIFIFSDILICYLWLDELPERDVPLPDRDVPLPERDELLLLVPLDLVVLLLLVLLELPDREL
jgi:hypothetical protein